MKKNIPIWKQRYYDAHLKWFKQKYPQSYKDGFYCTPKIPPINKSNGLTKFIINAVNYLGGNATRISSAGRLIDAPERQASGTILTVKKYIPSTTRKGTADVTATIKGRSVKWEVKVGNDKPSIYQLAEQQRELNAGGFYFFVHTPEEFWQQYDEVGTPF